MDTTLATDKPALIWRIESYLEALSDRTILLLLLVLIAAFHLLTLREGYNLTSDSAHYVLHAKNLVEGRPYAAGYIANPENPLDPAAYPRGFPWLLVPVVALFGTNVLALKVLVTLIFIASLGVLWYLFKDDLPRGQCVAVVATVGFSPIFWDLKHAILSDIPYMIVTLLALLGLEKARDSRGREQIAWAVAAGFFGYYAFLTRSLGAILFVCFVLCALIRFRTYFKPVVVALLAAATFHVLLSSWIAGSTAPDSAAVAPSGAGEGYSVIVQGTLGWVADNVLFALKISSRVAMEYIAFLSGVFDNGYSDAGRIVVFAILTVPAAVGFFSRLRRRFSVLEVFFVLYFLSLLPWGWVWGRYLVPLIPLYLFYLWIGTERLNWLLDQRLGRIRLRLVPAVTVLIAIVYLFRYTTLDYGPIEPEFLTPATYELAEYVEDNTAPDAVLVSGLDTRGLALLTGRTFTLPHRASDEELLDYFQAVGATYVVVPHRGSSRQVLVRVVANNPMRFRRLYGNGEYQLYRFSLPSSVR